DAAPAAIRVFDAVSGRAVPAQILERQGRQVTLMFLAAMPSVGFKVYGVEASTTPATWPSELRVTPTTLANARYAVTIDANGDISSVVDREAKRELLKSPVRLEMRDDPSPDKPAWRILYETVTAPVREYPTKPTIRIVERGPGRVALEITRQAGPSTIVQRVML